jgi:hypothetical protein
MYRSASIHLYDVMDQVHITVQVLLSDGLEYASPVVEYRLDADIQGVGSGDAHSWLRDALVAIIEHV